MIRIFEKFADFAQAVRNRPGLSQCLDLKRFVNGITEGTEFFPFLTEGAVTSACIRVRETSFVEAVNKL